MENKDKSSTQNTSRRKHQKVLGDLQLESSALRQVVFNQWFTEKQKERNRRLKMISRKQEALRLQEQKETEDKMNRSKKSFQAWLERKKREKKDTSTLARSEDPLKDGKNTLLQKSEAVKAFQMWKSQKDKLLKDKREEEERQKKSEQEKLAEKKAEGQIAFRLWKEQKDHEKWKTFEHLVEINSRTTTQNKMIQERRLRLALRAFNTWLAEKIFQSFYFDDEPMVVEDDRPPWYPPGPL